MSATPLQDFMANLKYLVSEAKQHPRFIDVKWSPVTYESVPTRVNLDVAYAPDGSKVIVQHFSIDARVIVNRDLPAFVSMCVRATE